jgi:hypothetical protein
MTPPGRPLGGQCDMLERLLQDLLYLDSVTVLSVLQDLLIPFAATTDPIL